MNWPRIKDEQEERVSKRYPKKNFLKIFFLEAEKQADECKLMY